MIFFFSSVLLQLQLYMRYVKLHNRYQNICTNFVAYMQPGKRQKNSRQNFLD